MFYTLVGLLCLDPSNPETCSTKIWMYEDYFQSEDVCMQMGEAQLGSTTPYGVVVSFKCESSGDPA